MKLYIDDRRHIDTMHPLDISLVLTNDPSNVRAWYVDAPMIEPVRSGDFVGAVSAGGSVNFRNVFFNPHGHGTHTECLGHITPEVYSVNDSLRTFFFKALLVTLTPQECEINGTMDKLLRAAELEEKIAGGEYEALIIRTMPNESEKKSFDYSASNPPYLELAAIEVMEAAGIKHLLIDLPSVDREEDGGELRFHHAFWKVPQDPQFDRTITELIYVDSNIQDGEYVLELQMAAFRNDAAPSRPVLYQIKEG